MKKQSSSKKSPLSNRRATTKHASAKKHGSVVSLPKTRTLKRKPTKNVQAQPRKAINLTKSQGYSKRNNSPPRTSAQYFSLSPKRQEQWTLAAHVIQKVRTQGVSVTQASKEYGIDRKKVIKLAGPALRKQKNGRYKAKSFDRLLRILVIPSKDGLREVAVRDSRTASKIAEYSAAVQRFLRTGDKSRLREFRKLRLNDAEGNPIKLLTSPKELTRLGSAGVLSFESLYARVA